MTPSHDSGSWCPKHVPIVHMVYLNLTEWAKPEEARRAHVFASGVISFWHLQEVKFGAWPSLSPDTIKKDNLNINRNGSKPKTWIQIFWNLAVLYICTWIWSWIFHIESFPVCNHIFRVMFEDKITLRTLRAVAQQQTQQDTVQSHRTRIKPQVFKGILVFKHNMVLNVPRLTISLDEQG